MRSSRAAAGKLGPRAALLATTPARTFNACWRLLDGRTTSARTRRSRFTAVVPGRHRGVIRRRDHRQEPRWDHHQGAERIYGYPATEMIGRSIAVLTAPDQSEEIAGILMRIKEGERVEHYETKRRRKDGSIIDISLTVSPIKDENDRLVGASAIG